MGKRPAAAAWGSRAGVQRCRRTQLPPRGQLEADSLACLSPFRYADRETARGIRFRGLVDLHRFGGSRSSRKKSRLHIGVFNCPGCLPCYAQVEGPPPCWLALARPELVWLEPCADPAHRWRILRALAMVGVGETLPCRSGRGDGQWQDHSRTHDDPTL